MNGVDAVVIASGNDWRGVEAGAHAYAARSGRYQPLAVWSTDGGGPVRLARDADGGRHRGRHAAGARGAPGWRSGSWASSRPATWPWWPPAWAWPPTWPPCGPSPPRGSSAATWPCTTGRWAATAPRAQAEWRGPGQVGPAGPLERCQDDPEDPQGGSGHARAAGAAGPPRARPAPLRWLDPPPGPYSVEAAYRYCEEFARAHHESYPVASRLVPADLRPHVIALYAFGRAADDFADEPEYEGRRERGARRLARGALPLLSRGGHPSRCSWPSPTPSRSAG